MTAQQAPDESYFPAVIKTKSYASEEIIKDPENRWSADFKVPTGLEQRVQFWFDVYSKYDSAHRIIHHVDYPWIQFKILDHTELLAQPAQFSWINPEKADKLTKLELTQTRLKLTKLHRKVKKGQLSELDEEEKKWLEALQQIPGPILRNLKEASQSVRVQTGQKDFFSKGLVIAEKYFPHMEKIFDDRNLPTELTRLPLVESSFNGLATSKAGAAGLWQFMHGTGKKFLIINSFIDERRSPLKSTEAAADLLNENFRIMFKSWPLAITAYNHGPVGIRKAVKVLKSHDIAKIVNHFESNRFSFASENYYCEFLAALYVEKYRDYLFPEIKESSSLKFEIFQMTQRLKPSKILNSGLITKDAFIELNPDLKVAVKWNIPLPKGLNIYVTPEMVGFLEELKHRKVARNPIELHGQLTDSQ